MGRAFALEDETFWISLHSNETLDAPNYSLKSGQNSSFLFNMFAWFVAVAVVFNTVQSRKRLQIFLMRFSCGFRRQLKGRSFNSPELWETVCLPVSSGWLQPSRRSIPQCWDPRVHH